MRKSRISNLAELQEEKRKLTLLSKVTKREISHSLGYMQTEIKDIALNNVAIPMGMTAATGLLINKIASSSDDVQETKKADANGGGLAYILMSLVPLAMKLINTDKE